MNRGTMTSALVLGQREARERPEEGPQPTQTAGSPVDPQEAPSQNLILSRACVHDTWRGCLIYPGLGKHLECQSLMKTKALYQSQQLGFDIIREILSRLRGRAGSVISSEERNSCV